LVKKQLEDEAIVNEMDEGRSRAVAPATRDSALAIKGPMADGAEDSRVEPIANKEDDMADDDFFLTESRSASGESGDEYESEEDEISKDSQPISSSSQEEQPLDRKTIVATGLSSVPEHDSVIQGSNERRKLQTDAVTKRKSNKATKSRATGKTQDSLRQHTRKPVSNGETKTHGNTRKKVGKRDKSDSKKASKSKNVVKQPLRTRAEGGRKRRKKAQ
jgi:hypothetical protein